MKFSEEVVWDWAVISMQKSAGFIKGSKTQGKHTFQNRLPKIRIPHTEHDLRKLQDLGIALLFTHSLHAAPDFSVRPL